MASEALNMIAFPPFHRELVVYVNRKVKDKALSEDIVQEVFIKVQTKLGQLKDHSKVTSWIYQITGNTIIDHFRSKSKTLKPSDLDWENERHEFNECVASCLSKLLNTLPEKYRVPLELAEIQNLSQTEIAQRLGLSYSATKSRVQRARQMLKARMDELYKIETDAYGNVLICEDRAGFCDPNTCVRS